LNWKPDGLLRALLIWTGVTTLFTWLPLVRSVMDGPTYEWGGSFWGVGFHGRGLCGDFWVLPLAAAFALAMLWLGWRGARFPFHPLLVAWHVPAGIRATYFSITRPEDFRFRGDTLGIDFSLAWAGPLFFGGFGLLAMWWVVRDWRSRRAGPRVAVSVPWTRAGTILLAIAAALLPAQFFLLHYGPPHDRTDAVGVFLTIAQWILINVALSRRPA
jgi:hypothetical protein